MHKNMSKDEQRAAVLLYLLCANARSWKIYRV